MPISKRRKKKGKKVRGHGGYGGSVKVDPNKESSVTLQDIINALAWEESKKPDSDPTKMVGPQKPEEILDMIMDGKVLAEGGLPPNTVLAEDAVINIGDEIPIYVGEGENKRKIGSASKIPEHPEQVSIHIKDSEMIRKLESPTDHFSISDVRQSDG